MTCEEYLSNMKPGYIVDAGSEEHLVMHELSQRALKITMELKNGNLKGSINAGRYTADYLQCGNLPYLAWKNAHNCAGLSYRRIRRYLV